MKTITILLIEDNTQDIRLINEMLKEIRSFNYNLVSAATLKEGFEQIQKNNFDIILLDLNLPDSTGQQTFQKVMDLCKEIPVVLVTGNEDQELSVKLIMEGAQDYITKQSLNSSSLEKSILYSIERQALLSNIKTQKAEITRIEKERILLAKFPSQSPDPILRVAGNGKLLYINEAGIKLLPDWQLIIDETIPSWLKDIIYPIFIEGTNIEFELGHREFIYFFYAVPLFEEGYINLYGRDITERKRKEEELIIANKELAFQNEEKEKRAAELTRIKQLLDETGRLARIGGWEIDLKKNELIWSDGVYQIHEVDPDYQPTVESATNFYSPEAIPVICEAVRQATEEGKSFDLDMQLITAKQNRIWVRTIGQAYHVNGEIVKIGGVFQDITGRKQVEEAIIQSKKDWENTFDSITDMVTIHDQDYNIILANKAGKAMLKLPEIEKHLKLKCYSFYHGASEPPAGCPSCDCMKSGLRGVFELFEPYLNLYLEIRAIPRFDSNNQQAGMIHIVRDISERKQAEQALNNSQQELRKFATHLQNVREEEKIALAREIHDDLAQISVALKIDLGLFERKLSKGIEVTTSEELLSKLKNFSGQVDNSIKSARRIMNGLRPELIELLGFEEACKSYLHDFDEAHRLSCQFESAILNLNISLEQSVALFRILQEALNNIIKHAKATLVTVQLSNSAGKLVLQVVDNGVGFDENKKGRSDSYGLIGMKERVFLLEGELFISSKVGKGTSVRVEIPY